MFIRRFFLLTYSHFVVKDLPFGRFTTFGAALFLKNDCSIHHTAILLHLIGLLPPTIFLKIGLAISPNKGPAKDAISPSRIAPPFWFFLFSFFLTTNVPNTFFYYLFSYIHTKKIGKINTRDIE